jgi:hypothetical protein
MVSNTETAQYSSISQLATYVNELSRSIVKANPNLGQWAPGSTIYPETEYPGVDIHVYGNTIYVYDNTQSTTPVKIGAFDLIGQPTWLALKQIQVTTVMRCDVLPGKTITLPTTRTQANAGVLGGLGIGRSPANELDNVIFGGTWQVRSVRHIGNYKDPSGEMWSSVINCFGPIQTSATGTAALTPQTSPPPPLNPFGGANVVH